MALRITRKVFEGFVICDKDLNVIARIDVIDYERGEVKFAIEADRSLPVHRVEVFDKLKKAMEVSGAQ